MKRDAELASIGAAMGGFLPAMLPGGPERGAAPAPTPNQTHQHANSGITGPVNAHQRSNASGGNLVLLPGLGTAAVFLIAAMVLAFIAWRVLA